MIRLHTVDLWKGSRKVKAIFHEIYNTKQKSQNELLEIAEKYSKNLLALQFFNPDLIAGVEHLLSASQNALNALTGQYYKARSLDVEIILYASCQRQIGVALNTLGIRDKPASVALVAIAEDSEVVCRTVAEIISLIGIEAPNPFQVTEERISRIATHFGIESTEIQTVSESETLDARYEALKRCISSRVSMVAFES
ncbi:MAG: hypothetical protein EAX81_02070 [Candidatus Thorarchaeota archaeon]|nr:hypothetical protein [Candidatus Thorarchaeota archaeon]